MALEPQTYIFISRSGGGKGTQIALLRQYFDDHDLGEVFHLEVGDIFRNFFQQDTYVSNLAKEITNRGELQPSFLAVWAWGTDLIKNLEAHHHLFIDGTPRQTDEQQILVEALNFFGRKKITVVHVNISRECALDRMTSRHRDDDNIDGIKKRLDWFDKDVLPVLEVFKQNPDCTYLEIDGEREIDDIHRDILSKIKL